ncbi:hypothetical protein ACHAXT_010571 [Thalassiosira profunda]
MRALAIISTLGLAAAAVDAFTCSGGRRTTLFASSGSGDDVGGLSCGPGFKRVEGADGPCCAFDFDAITKATLQIDEEDEPTTCDATMWFDDNPGLRAAFEDKNEARRKFDLPPLRPEEFLVLQAEIHAMEREQEAIQTVQRAVIAEKREVEAAERRREETSPLQSFMESVFQSTCASNYDCDRPEVCCDFGFKKVCCTSGDYKRDIENELAMIKVPQRR